MNIFNMENTGQHSSWDAQRPVIERLYLQEGRTLKDTMTIMESVHGFRMKYVSI